MNTATSTVIDEEKASSWEDVVDLEANSYNNGYEDGIRSDDTDMQEYIDGYCTGFNKGYLLAMESTFYDQIIKQHKRQQQQKNNTTIAIDTSNCVSFMRNSRSINNFIALNESTMSYDYNTVDLDSAIKDVRRLYKFTECQIGEFALIPSTSTSTSTSMTEKKQHHKRQQQKQQQQRAIQTNEW